MRLWCLCLILSCETFLLGTSLGTALGATNPVQLFLLVLLERLWGSLGASLTALGASLGALGRSWELFGGSWGRPCYRNPFVSKNEGFALVGARFWKPVQARTGSEIMRERVCSRELQKEAGSTTVCTHNSMSKRVRE